MINLARWMLIDRHTGRRYIPNPRLAYEPDLSFDKRWVLLTPSTQLKVFDPGDVDPGQETAPQ